MNLKHTGQTVKSVRDRVADADFRPVSGTYTVLRTVHGHRGYKA